MNPLNIDDVVAYVENNIETFHRKRVESVGKIKLDAIVKRKNP